jgi:hypothetical protein
MDNVTGTQRLWSSKSIITIFIEQYQNEHMI